MPFSGGSGTPDDPYLVANFCDLWYVREYPDAHFRQVADIDMAVIGDCKDPYGDLIGAWEPIPQLSGSYDGGGYKIYNLSMDWYYQFYEPASVLQLSAIFGFIGATATVTNVILSNANINFEIDPYEYASPGFVQEIFVGLLAGENWGQMRCCRTQASILSVTLVRPNNCNAAVLKGSVGGLVGRNMGSIVTSASAVTVKGCIEINTIVPPGQCERHPCDIPHLYIGGLIGLNGNTVGSSYSRSRVETKEVQKYYSIG